MITDKIIYLFWIFANALLSPLSSVNLDTGFLADFTNGLSQASIYLSMIDAIFPVSTFLIIVGLVITVEGFVILLKIFNWVRRLLPF
jgi:hypothetical protein